MKSPARSLNPRTTSARRGPWRSVLLIRLTRAAAPSTGPTGWRDRAVVARKICDRRQRQCQPANVTKSVMAGPLGTMPPRLDGGERGDHRESLWPYHLPVRQRGSNRTKEPGKVGVEHSENTSKLRSTLRPIPSVEPRPPSFVSVARISQGPSGWASRRWKSSQAFSRIRFGVALALTTNAEVCVAWLNTRHSQKRKV